MLVNFFEGDGIIKLVIVGEFMASSLGKATSIVK